MTIDERLERLAERHEALTQAVDLLAAMLQQNERRMAQVLDAINRLANIAEAHAPSRRPVQRRLTPLVAHA
jgi:prefoldin subunit 5